MSPGKCAGQNQPNHPLRQQREPSWRTSAKQPVKNVDLWQELVAACEQHDVEWHWVKGHAGDEGNERADRLAARGLEEAVEAAQR